MVFKIRYCLDIWVDWQIPNISSTWRAFRRHLSPTTLEEEIHVLQIQLRHSVSFDVSINHGLSNIQQTDNE